MLWAISKLLRVRDFPRYLAELPPYLRGYAYYKTRWGDDICVPFPEFRAIGTTGILPGTEVDTYEYLNERIGSGDVFFDIGANAGFYALLAASKGAKVHAFEPFPATYQILKRNKRVNGYRDMQTYEEAVSDMSGTLRMQVAESPGLNRISDDGTVAVWATTLDQFSITAPTIMKIDVEGHEYQVIQGARQTLLKYKPIVVMEAGPAVREFMQSLGYTVRKLGTDANAGNYVFEPSNESKTRARGPR